jgi:hypothetical protein
MRDDQRSRCSTSEDELPASRDRRMEALVLDHLVDLHPVHVSVSELTKELATDPDDFGGRDEVERAVRELARIGLLHHHNFRNRDDPFVPTRAALHVYDLVFEEYDRHRSE